MTVVVKENPSRNSKTKFGRRKKWAIVRLAMNLTSWYKLMFETCYLDVFTDIDISILQVKCIHVIYYFVYAVRGNVFIS